MADTIRLKRSLQPGLVPQPSSLVEGELALNIPDKKLYILSGSTVVSILGSESTTSGSIETSQLILSTAGGNFIITGSTLTGIFNETALITPFVSAIDFSGAIVDYNAQRDNAARLGTLMVSWSGSAVTYSDNSTGDIGETEDLLFEVVRVDDEIRLRARSMGSGSGAWSVSSTITLFPNLL